MTFIPTPAARAKLAASKSKVDWYVLTPDGVMITVRNLKQFCREHGLNFSHMYMVANGYERQHKGYKAYRGDDDDD